MELRGFALLVTATAMGLQPDAAEWFRANAAHERGELTVALGALARDRTGDEEGSKEPFRRALVLNPDDFDANLNFGAVLYRQRELQAARELIERAIRLQPASSMARYALALINAGTGSSSEALEDLQRPRAKLASLYFRMNRPNEEQNQRAEIDKLIAEKRDQHASFEQ